MKLEQYLTSEEEWRRELARFLLDHSGEFIAESSINWEMNWKKYLISFRLEGRIYRLCVTKKLFSNKNPYMFELKLLTLTSTNTFEHESIESVILQLRGGNET